MMGLDSIIEGLFAMVVVIMFVFFVIARAKGKNSMDMYNETMDKVFGETKDLNIENPLSKLKNRRSVPIR